MKLPGMRHLWRFIVLKPLERFKNTVANSERGFLVFGKALAKAQVCKTL
jgi:hypothetical protein